MPSDRLSPARLEAFSDGVIAVIITIMVLELKVPTLQEATTSAAIHEDLKMIAVYLLSFVQTGIYWVNHHYLLDDLETVSHGVLWSNLIFLFCLSLIPFGTEWLGIRGITSIPVVVYVVCFVVPSLAWVLLSTVVRGRTGIRPPAGALQQAVSAFMNVAAIPVALWQPWVALGMIAVVAILWLLPPRKIVEITRHNSPSPS